MTRTLIGFLLASLTLMAHAETARFYGYAFDRDTDKYLYTEVHEQVIEEGVWKSGTIHYVAPDGSPMGKKTMDFSKSGSIPIYRLDLPYVNYSEGISKVTDAEVALFKINEGQRSEKTVKRSQNLAADSGFHNLIREHFAALMGGETVKMRLAVAGNLDSYRFRLRKTGETTFDGKPAVQFKIELDSLLRLLVDDLQLTYEPEARRLVVYRGISNVHNPATGKPYNARIVYTDQAPEGAPDDLPPLTGR